MSEAKPVTFDRVDCAKVVVDLKAVFSDLSDVLVIVEREASRTPKGKQTSALARRSLAHLERLVIPTMTALLEDVARRCEKNEVAGMAQAVRHMASPNRPEKA
jgi:hypothetical protein